MQLDRFLLAVVAFVLSSFAATVQAQTPVRVLVGFQPGGTLDTLARLSSEKLAEGLGRPVVVENRAGAAGRIAGLALKASAPDGNTLMVVPDGALALYPHTVKKPVYDTLRDFVPIAHLGAFDYGLAVHANVPARNVAEWINWVKADIKNAAFGSPGAGTGQHFIGLLLAQATGVPLVNVPYRGAAPALADLAAGQVPSAISTLGSLSRLASAGKVRILAHTGSRRSSIAPEVATFKELGYPALEASGWYGMIAPAGIPSEVVVRYNQILTQAQQTPAMRDRLRKLDIEPRVMAPAELVAMLKAQYDRWGPIVKASGFSADSQ